MELATRKQYQVTDKPYRNTADELRADNFSGYAQKFIA